MSKLDTDLPNTKTRGYKLRFYPTRVQRKKLTNMFGASRHVYTWALKEKSTAWSERQESLSINALSKQLTQLKKTEKIWLKEISASIVSQSLRDLKTAYKNFFDPSHPAKYPTEKRRSHAQSCRMQLDHRHIAKYFSGVKAQEFFNVPGLGQLNVKFCRDIVRTPKMITFKMTSAGEYYVSFNCIEEIATKPQSNRSVGVDLGIKDIAKDSNGHAYGNPTYYHKFSKKLAKAQRRLAKMQKFSNRWKKQRKKIALLHDRVARSRSDFLHGISNALIDENQVIVLEDLNVKGMMQNRKLARSLSDAALGELTRQVKYKAQWFGREFLQVSRWFPSSQLCSTQGCDYRHTSLKLSDRQWTCPSCKTQHDRDENAAKNILIEGLRTYRELHGSLPAGLASG